jgi:hypothetical protein
MSLTKGLVSKRARLETELQQVADALADTSSELTELREHDTRLTFEHLLGVKFDLVNLGADSKELRLYPADVIESDFYYILKPNDRTFKVRQVGHVHRCKDHVHVEIAEMEFEHDDVSGNASILAVAEHCKRVTKMVELSKHMDRYFAICDKIWTTEVSVARHVALMLLAKRSESEELMRLPVDVLRLIGRFIIF